MLTFKSSNNVRYTVPYNTQHIEKQINSIRETRRYEKMTVEEYIISEKYADETVADYCYMMYQDWLDAWKENPCELFAYRANMWRFRFLQFAEVKKNIWENIDDDHEICDGCGHYNRNCTCDEI